MTFVRGDACNLDPALGTFDFAFAGNLLDRLPDPQAFLTKIGSFIRPGGLLILTTPYTWMNEYTDPSKWIGGVVDGHVLDAE